MDATESRCFDCWSRWNGSFIRLYSAGGGLEVVLQDTNHEHVEAIQRDGLQIKGFGGDRKVEITAIMIQAKFNQLICCFFSAKEMHPEKLLSGSNILPNKGSLYQFSEWSGQRGSHF